MPVGAEPSDDRSGAWFRVWAPRRKSVEVVIEGAGADAVVGVALAPEADGYFSGHVRDPSPGALYRYRLDGGERLFPDPASRFQPQGPHGPSELVDPARFRWTDERWPGITPAGLALYEMHVGTFTREGTWQAAAERLPVLRDLGVTCVEVMPIHEFPGRFGWGYDGVNLFAPYHHYGRPDDLRHFVDGAHAAGIGVILDVVYNHFGPDGNYLSEFAAEYFSTEHDNDWGAGLNFDGRGSGPVREYFLHNALYWLREFHFDGFRFDATQAIVDRSPRYILAEINQACRAAAAAAGRSVYLTNENEPQRTCFVRPAEAGGYGMDSLWNDDFHHSAMAALTGRSEAYYTDTVGSPQEMISCAKYGYLYQGQRYSWQKQRRGTPALDLPSTAFVNYIQNHDQIANSGRGWRVDRLTSPAELRAMTTLMLLMPQAPMLFQGQEFAASSPFYYFADHRPDLAELIRSGRITEMGQFPSVATEAMRAVAVDPSSAETFERAKLDWSEIDRPPHAEVFRLHKDVLALRRDDPAFARARRRGEIDGAVLGPDAFLLRYFEPDGDDRLLVVNLGRDLELRVAPEPLLAPPAEKGWWLAFSSEHPCYGGGGMAAVETEEEGWLLPARCAAVLLPRPAEEARVRTRVVRHGSEPRRPREDPGGKA